MSRARFTPSEQQEVVRLYVEDGQSCAQIAERYQKSCGCITYALRQAGVRPAHRQDGRNRSKGNEADIVALYRGGQTVRQIAKRFRSTIDTVSGVLRQEGVTPLTAPQRRRAVLATQEEDIVSAYRNGDTLKMISKRYHVSHPVLKALLASHGVRVRTPIEYKTSLTQRARKVRKANTVAIVEGYTKAQWSVARLAKLYRMDESSVACVLREAGVKIDPYRRGRPTVEQESEMVRLYASGSRIKDIQKVVNHRFITVRKVLVKHGVSIRTRLQINTRRFGYIGTYRHFLFRSLMELSFILDHEATNHVESAETLPIVYQDGKRKRTYYPDFLLNGTQLVELKPVSYRDDARVIAKAKAARAFCEQKGWSYTITDWPVDKARIGRLVQDGVVRITNRTPQEVAKYLGFTHDLQNA